MSQQYGIVDYTTSQSILIGSHSVNSTDEKFTIEILLKTIESEVERKLFLWPEEEQALENIHTGKTKMITQSGEDFLKELNELVNGS